MHGTRQFVIAAILSLLVMQPMQASEVMRMRVEPYLQPAGDRNPGFCYVVDDGSGPRLLSEPIGGFNFQWGVRSQITVNVERRSDPVDTSKTTLEYRLVTLDKEEKVEPGTHFQIFVWDRAFIRGQSILGLKRFSFISKDIETTFYQRMKLLEGTPPRAAIPGLGGEQDKPKVGDDRRIILEFSYPADSSQPLVLENMVGLEDLKLE